MEGLMRARLKGLFMGSNNGGKGGQEKTGFRLGNGQGLVGSTAECSQVWGLENQQEHFYSTSGVGAVLSWAVTSCFCTFDFIAINENYQTEKKM